MNQLKFSPYSVALFRILLGSTCILNVISLLLFDGPILIHGKFMQMKSNWGIFSIYMAFHRHMFYIPGFAHLLAATAFTFGFKTNKALFALWVCEYSLEAISWGGANHSLKNIMLLLSFGLPLKQAWSLDHRKINHVRFTCILISMLLLFVFPQCVMIWVLSANVLLLSIFISQQQLHKIFKYNQR